MATCMSTQVRGGCELILERYGTRQLTATPALPSLQAFKPAVKPQRSTARVVCCRAEAEPSRRDLLQKVSGLAAALALSRYAAVMLVLVPGRRGGRQQSLGPSAVALHLEASPLQARGFRTP